MIPGQKSPWNLRVIWSFVQAGFMPQLALPTWDAMGPAAPFSAQASCCMQTLPHRRSSRPFQLFLSTTKLTKEKKPYELFFKLELQDTLETYLGLSLNWYHQLVSYWLLSYWRRASLCTEQITRKCFVSKWMNDVCCPKAPAADTMCKHSRFTRVLTPKEAPLNTIVFSR